jgi:Sugar-specific transcriptional regulator TrmB.
VLQLEKIDLSSSEIEVLEVLVRKSEFISIKDLAEIVNKPISSLESIISLLKSKNLVEIKEHKKVEYKLTRTGLDALKNGLPETRLLLILKIIKN